MSRPSAGSIIIYFLLLLIFIGAIIYTKMTSPYDPINPSALLIAFILFLNFAVVAILEYRSFLRQLMFRLWVITRTRRYKYIAALSVFQMIIAVICYLNYRSNPMLYVSGDAIEKRHKELTKEQVRSDSIYIGKFKDDFSEEIKALEFFLKHKDKFSESSDGNLLVGDSLIIVVSDPFTPPKVPHRTHLDFYSKDHLTYLRTATFKYGKFDIEIPNEIEHLKDKLSMAKDDLTEISVRSTDFRWSFVQFVNLYFREQLQSMSIFLMAMDGLRYLVWSALSLLIASPLWGKIKKPED